MKQTTTNFKTLGDIVRNLATMLQPPERISVSQAAEKYRVVNQPGAYVGPWWNHTVPYMVEPMNEFASPRYEGLIFVGSAQSGKTDSLVINALVYSVKVDPMDTMVVCPTQTDARDFSIRRVDRLHRHSEEVGAMLLNKHGDNVFDKRYTTGMLLTLAHPAPGQLSGKPIGRIMLTDRDRMVDDVGGDGEPYDLASMRTTTYGSYAMTVAESSPSRPVTDLKWIPRSPHEAPPCTGIIGLYNRGDRRRWYWPCPHCGEYFEGQFKHLEIAEDAVGTNYERSRTVRMRCPRCQQAIHFDDRNEMQMWGVWVKDGQGVLKDGTVFGPEPRTLIASFWLRGVAARFTTWAKLMSKFLDANDEYERTGSEEALKKFHNNDLGEPYYPRSTSEMRLPEVLKARAEKLGERVVPANVRFLVALVDVQKNHFTACVFGISPGTPYDIVVIDRFDIRKSSRLDENGERHFVRPGTYEEDWDLLITEVMEKEYPLSDDSGRMMGIKMTGCDSGGEDGVTTRAYAFYRRLRDQNKHRRFVLTKGNPLPNQPRTRIITPDSQRKDAKAVARGDVPVLFLNSNLLKDELDGRLDCLEPGKGMYRTPDWLSDSFYNELCSEVRDPAKGWVTPSNTRNEQWDLSYMCLGLCVSLFVNIESVDWSNPPGWAGEWERNDFIRLPEAKPRFANELESQYDFAQFGKALAGA